MNRRQTPHKKRSLGRERKALDRAILRLTRTFYSNQTQLEQSQQAELFGLVCARRRVS